ncbi:MAG: adenylate kinase [Anaerolineae bacterium]|nr:adenylate kinase [Anaerolineae bacterium]
MSTVVVLLGPPGSGKGTQAKRLVDVLGTPHVSSGDLFRHHLSRETELGLMAKSYMEQGGLVPDDVTVKMVIERISRPDCEEGVVLDGFPRTLTQAEALDGALEKRGQEVTVVPLIEVNDDEVLRRLTARRTCEDCGAVYNLLFSPPQEKGVCDVCGGSLYQREDDNPETVRHRLYTYYKETSPLIGYYFAKGVLVEVDGEQSVDEVHKELRETIKAAREQV